MCFHFCVAGGGKVCPGRFDPTSVQSGPCEYVVHAHTPWALSSCSAGALAGCSLGLVLYNLHESQVSCSICFSTQHPIFRGKENWNSHGFLSVLLSRNHLVLLFSVFRTWHNLRDLEESSVCGLSLWFMEPALKRSDFLEPKYLPSKSWISVYWWWWFSH